MSAERSERPPAANPQEIIEINEDIFSAWDQLPTHDKAAVALILLDRVWKGERGEWLREAISLRWPEEIAVLAESYQLRLRADKSLTNDLSAEERDKIQQALEKVGHVFERILKEREALAEKGVTTSQAFSFLTELMHDTESFYGVLSGSLGPTDEEEFPF